MTSTKDDRVHPGHARKMAARMEEMGLPFLYYENIDGGHAAAANLQRARQAGGAGIHLSDAPAEGLTRLRSGQLRSIGSESAGHRRTLISAHWDVRLRPKTRPRQTDPSSATKRTRPSNSRTPLFPLAMLAGVLIVAPSNSLAMEVADGI